MLLPLAPHFNWSKGCRQRVCSAIFVESYFAHAPALKLPRSSTWRSYISRRRRVFSASSFLHRVRRRRPQHRWCPSCPKTTLRSPTVGQLPLELRDSRRLCYQGRFPDGQGLHALDQLCFLVLNAIELLRRGHTLSSNVSRCGRSSIIHVRHSPIFAEACRGRCHCWITRR